LLIRIMPHLRLIPLTLIIHSVASRGPSLLILALSVTDIGAKILIWSSIYLFIYYNCLVILLSARVFKIEKYLAFAVSILRNKAI
jgi:hypothetical protein